MMDNVLAILVGLGLSAACGFRVFIPLLVMSIAAHSGHLSLTPGFAWIGSNTALITFAVAAVLEISGYYVPWVDHLLDTLATPAAVVAGTVVMASCISDMSPFLRWTLAAVAGGGTAGLVQGATVLGRGASSGLTGGLGNPLFATAELGGSVFTSILALVVPLATILLLAGCVGAGCWAVNKRRHTVGSVPSVPAS